MWATIMFDTSLPTTKRLFDLATRQQLYVEGVKRYEQSKFNSVMRDVYEQFKKLFANLQYDTLDGMTKSVLMQLTVSLRDSQEKVYSAWADDLLSDLKDFSNGCDLQSVNTFYDDSVTEDDLEDLADELEQEDNGTPILGFAALSDSDALWSKISNAIIPANGLLLTGMINGLTSTAKTQLANALRMGYANGWTVFELLDYVNYNNGLISRIVNNGASIVETSVQHAYSLVNANVFSAGADKYRWCSIMDSRTSDICRSRNGKIYQYGKGPLPPAHYRCRSKTTPITDAESESFEYPSSLQGWFNAQPGRFKADVLRVNSAEGLTNSQIVDSVKPISVPEFKEKTKNITL